MKDPTFKEAPLFKCGVMGSIFYYQWEVEITAEKDMGGWVDAFIWFLPSFGWCLKMMLKDIWMQNLVLAATSYGLAEGLPKEVVYIK